jgi:hypothetical protein
MPSSDEKDLANCMRRPASNEVVLSKDAFIRLT